MAGLAHCPYKFDMFRAATCLCLLLLAAPAFAVQDFPVGAPVERNGMRIAPAYLTGAETDRMPGGADHGKDSVLLEADIHATASEAHGFPEGAWMPYLEVQYALTKDGEKTYKKAGMLFPMAARGGPNYAALVDLDDPGTYHLTLFVSPPTSHGLLRHVDKATGVPDWWKPFTLDWTFAYPAGPE